MQTGRINIAKFREDVRRARVELHVTQKQIAAEAGVGHAVIGKLFSGRLKRPTLRSVSGICSALGLDINDYYAEPITDIEQTHEGVKATLARANSMLDEVRGKLDVLKSTDEIPVTQNRDHAQEIAELKVQLENATDKIAELTAALDYKNSRLAEETRRADGLQVELNENDRLILHLITFIQRLKDGDVQR